MKREQPSSVHVVCHDAGGAEVVASWVQAHPELTYRFSLAGPAKAVFARKLPGITWDHRFVGDATTEIVLTGSGWSSDFERRAVRLAKDRHLRVATYLDHWTSYRERFELAGTLVLPDEIWVGDRFAFQIAAALFPGQCLRLEPNRYFEPLVQEILRLSSIEPPPDGGIRVLYVCEPIGEAARRQHGDPRAYGYTEFEALDGYLRHLRHRRASIGAIRLRLHPSEPQGKYRSIVETHRADFHLVESRNTSLVEDCAWADWIVGCDSMAMALAVQANKPVYSCIPHGGRPLSLPFPDIVKLF